MPLFHSPRSNRKSVGREEQVVFYPSFGSRAEDGRGWSLVLQGCVFDPRIPWLRRSPVMGLIRRAMRIDRSADEFYRQRMRRFMMAGLKGRSVTAEIGGLEFSVDESDYMGLFRSIVNINEDVVSREATPDEHGSLWLPCRAVLNPCDTRQFAGTMQLIEPKGVSIISDVDDTIKHSNVSNRRDLFRNTFAKRFVPVTGMPELYRACTQAGAVFHFVSGSPWQLYEPLHEFCRAEGYPAGSFHLKRFRFREAARKLRKSPQKAYKRTAIEPILDSFPHRRFVLIGDSGEQDPEIYGSFLRERPDQIIGVFIRAIRGETRDFPRIQEAFAGTDSDKWTLYVEPDEIRPRVSHLVERGASDLH